MTELSEGWGPELAILLGYAIESEIERIGKSEILRNAGDVSVYPIQADSPYSPFFAFDLYFVLNFENCQKKISY